MTARSWMTLRGGVGLCAAAVVGWLMAPGVADGRFDNGHILFGLGAVAGTGVAGVWAAEQLLRRAGFHAAESDQCWVEGFTYSYMAAILTWVVVALCGVDPVWSGLVLAFLGALGGFKLAAALRRLDAVRAEALDRRDPWTTRELFSLADLDRVLVDDEAQR